MPRHLRVQIDALRRQRLAAAERQQAAGQLGAAERTVQHLSRQVGTFRIVVQRIEQGIRYCR